MMLNNESTQGGLETTLRTAQCLYISCMNGWLSETGDMRIQSLDLAARGGIREVGKDPLTICDMTIQKTSLLEAGLADVTWQRFHFFTVQGGTAIYL